MGELDYRNLPPEVLNRLAGANVDLRGAHLEAVQRGRLLEARTFAMGGLLRDGTTGELRRDADGNPVLDGYATVYEYPYPVAGGPPYGWIETIAEGACTKSVRERDDVRLLINHEGIPLGRTRSKTLELESDTTGLRCASTLDGKSPLVCTLASAMDRDDMDEMSFAFRVIRQEWNSDYTERRILEVMLADVSVVTYPANPAALAQLRADGHTDPAPVARNGRLALAEAQAFLLARAAGQ